MRLLEGIDRADMLGRVGELETDALAVPAGREAAALERSDYWHWLPFLTIHLLSPAKCLTSNTMKKAHTRILAAMSVVMASSVASAQTPTSQAELVTVENYNRAQTDVYFAGVVKNGGFGKFRHGRELAPPAQQGIPRPNRDTLYSFAIVDLDAGPVTITLPDAGKRYMGMQVVNQDQYTPATYYGAGTHTLTREVIGTDRLR